MKRTSKWISSITLRVKFCQVSADQVTRRVNFRMATPWPWTPRATSSSLRSASETRQATEFRNSGSWRAGRCRSRSPKFCPPVISAAYTVAVDRQEAITPSHDRCHRTSSKRISSAHPHSSQSPVPTKKVVLIESVEFVTPRPVGWPSYVHPTGRNSTKRLSGWAFAKSSRLRSHAGRMPMLSD